MGVTVAVLLAVLGLAGVGAAGDAASRRPLLRFVDLDPLTVRGLNFKPDERVKLLVTAQKPYRLAAKASSRGEFTLKLAANVDRCTSVVVQAFGNKGSRAMVDILAPDCAGTDVSRP
jgi:hypothetical protein